jgi:hypothetical protein
MKKYILFGYCYHSILIINLLVSGKGNVPLNVRHVIQATVYLHRVTYILEKVGHR